MAKALPSFGRAIQEGSDNFPEHYCEPCFEVDHKIKPVAGYCSNCVENLCIECFISHSGPKLFRNHKLVDKSTRPKTTTRQQSTPRRLGEECLLHHGEKIHKFCPSHSQVCCKVCLTINHDTCVVEEISKSAINVHDSQELNNLNEKLVTLKNSFNEHLTKTGANESVIQQNYCDAINGMKKLRDEIDKLIAETEKQAEIVKFEDVSKIEKVSENCNIVIEQIEKMMAKLDELTQKQETESLFIAMKRAESQVQFLEEKLEKLDKDNTVTDYKFVPDQKLKSILNDLKVVGHLSTIQNISRSDQKAKMPTYLKDITVASHSDKEFSMYGSLVLSNNQILITDWENKKLKLIDTNQDTIISEMKLSGKPFEITKVTADEVAITSNGPPNKIQLFLISQNLMSLYREVIVGKQCRGIAYNNKDQTLIGAFIGPPKIKILDMAGIEIKCIEKGSNWNKLFKMPNYVALKPDMTKMYVTDFKMHSITLITMNGGVEAVLKDKTNRLRGPLGLCVHKSGLVYVAGNESNTVHELDPDSGVFKLILEEKDGLKNPASISYCDIENKMYIGQENSNFLKVFQMK